VQQQKPWVYFTVEFRNIFRGIKKSLLKVAIFLKNWCRAQILYFQAVLFNYVLNIAKAVSKEEIKQALYFISKKISHLNFSKDQLGFYLAGLIEGDGCISLPAIGNTKLNRVLNPRIVFTSHINNIGLYAFLQFELGGIGRFHL